MMQSENSIRSVVIVGTELERYLRVVRLDDKVKSGVLLLETGDALIGIELAKDLGAVLGDDPVVGGVEAADFAAAGYQAQWFGQKTYNGVALLSRSEAGGVVKNIPGLDDEQARVIAGTPITLEVRAVRKIRWDSFKPNFFLVTPPGVLDADGVNPPLQWIASFYLPREQRGLLRELIREFPNVTALDLDAALNQVRGIVDRIVGALEFIFLFTLLAGLVVMMAVIEGSRADRVRETGVLRALGASRRVIRQGLIAEYAVLGGLAGAVAAFAAQALAWALAVGVLELPYGPRPLLWLIGTLAGCAIVTLAGWFSLRKVLNTSPRIVLAGGAA